MSEGPGHVERVERVDRVDRIEHVDRIEIDDGETQWQFDAAFLRSNWTCIWGRGCHGIETERAAGLGLGCCSIGAVLDGPEESNFISATAAALTPKHFQHHRAARTGGIWADESKLATRVVDGACIFLNRPGFSGGAGCAFDLAAAAVGESRLEWKPSVCWQLPIHVDFEASPDGRETATVRAWRRSDWGAHGETMAWCCTERAEDGGTDEAFVGARPVVESMREELEEIVGTVVYVELRRRLG